MVGYGCKTTSLSIGMGCAHSGRVRNSSGSSKNSGVSTVVTESSKLESGDIDSAPSGGNYQELRIRLDFTEKQRDDLKQFGLFYNFLEG